MPLEIQATAWSNTEITPSIFHWYSPTSLNILNWIATNQSKGPKDGAHKSRAKRAQRPCHTNGGIIEPVASTALYTPIDVIEDDQLSKSHPWGPISFLEIAHTNTNHQLQSQ